MTDAEIIKALECCLDTSPLTCKNCPLFKATISTMVCSKVATKFALDLINRQKAEIERLQSMNQAKLDTIHDLLAENERLKAEKDKLAEDWSNLTIEKDQLFDEAKALIEKAKAEAIKEFAERLSEKIINSIEQSQNNVDGDNYYVSDVLDDIDNFVKKMAGDME